eukprot:2307226-Pyramimonas_sp.AAC.1
MLDCGGDRLARADEHGHRRVIAGRQTDAREVLPSTSQIFRCGKQVAWLAGGGGCIDRSARRPCRESHRQRGPVPRPA